MKARIRDRLLETWVTACGLGHAPVAPGTFGTLGGVALAALFGFTWAGLYAVLVAAAAVLVSWGGALAGAWAERRFGRKDPGAFVVDEVAGYLVAAWWPVFPGWTHLLLAFFAFRFFDIFKPPPARRLEKLRGGWGIVVDDLVAGGYALLLLAVLRQIVPGLQGTP